MPCGGWRFGPQPSQVGPGAAAWGPPGLGEVCRWHGQSGNCPKSHLGPAVEGQEELSALSRPTLERKLQGGEEGPQGRVWPGPGTRRPMTPSFFYLKYTFLSIFSVQGFMPGALHRQLV